MRNRPSRCALLTGGALVIAVLVSPSTAIPAQGQNLKKTLRFAADMARSGNWREARHRWEEALGQQPQNPRVLNNLAVAAEALGEMEQAGRYYDQALALSGVEERIEDNRNRFLRVLEERRALQGQEDRADPPPDRPEPAAEQEHGGDNVDKKKGKPLRVSVAIPLPPRLELEWAESVLVASFRAPESSMLDVGREIVRFMRSEFRKRSRLDVRDVVPPPAIPEQTVEDLLANREFWKHLSREHDADLLVSGVITFGRRDASGFYEVDRIDEMTGQKVRRTQFVEQEEFAYELDVFFFDGATGVLLFRDRMKRSVIFRGEMNDPISAFYELSEAVAGDVLAVVAPRKRVEARVIFKN
jgi:hypothetical protein